MRLTFDQIWKFVEVRHPGQHVPARDKISVRCGLREEKNASCTWFLTGNGGFNCHGCGAKGSLLQFEMLFSKCDYQTAMRNVAAITGASLNGGGRQHVATYFYRDFDRIPGFKKDRYRDAISGEKSFAWSHCDDAGRWQPGEMPRWLYNAPEVVIANMCFLSEGEKCTDLLSKHAPQLWPERTDMHIACTCNPEGAWKPGAKPKWREEYSWLFSGKVVVIFADNDPSGRTWAEYIATQIFPYAAAVYLISFPDEREKFDIGDWIEGRSSDLEQMLSDLRRMIESAPLWKPDLQDQAAASSGDGFNLLTIGELLSRPDVPPDYLVHGIHVHGTVSCAVAKPKVGKSTYARNLCISVARGIPFLGHETQQGLCIYLALEERVEEVTADFRAMGAESGDPIEVHAAAAPAQAISAFADLVRKRRPALAVIDPMIRLAHIRDEKAYAEVYAALGPLIDIARETNTHIHLTHHSSKLPKTDPIDSPIGSTAIGGAVATLIVLAKRENYRTIETVTRIGTPIPETVLQFDPKTHLLSVGGTRAEVDSNALEEDITEYLKTAGEKKESEIDKHVEGKTTVKRKALRSLFEKGIVSRTGAGVKGDPYIFLFPCSTYIPGTREQESRIGPQPRVVNEEMLVPEKQQNLWEREQEKTDREQAFSGAGNGALLGANGKAKEAADDDRNAQGVSHPADRKTEGHPEQPPAEEEKEWV